MIILYAFVLVGVTLYSYALVDPNITLVQSPLWAHFRDIMVQLGYYHRDLSALLFIVLLVLISLLHVIAVKRYSAFPLKRFIIVTCVTLLLAYPFLSRDVFNYMFDAKIVTVYHQNPYLKRALDFPSDPWLRFMHWVQRTYPYGPTFLPLTLIPSFLSFGKLVLDIVLFKVVFLIAYCTTTFVLFRKSKKMAVFFATSPLILIEGIVNMHNDLISLALAAVGLYYLFDNKLWKSRIWLILSAGIKYISLPLILLTIPTNQKQKQRLASIALFGTVGSIMYVSHSLGVFQPWYLLNVFIFLPYFETWFYKSTLFISLILLTYYPFVGKGDWGMIGTVALKNTLLFAIILMYGIYCIVPPIYHYAKNHTTA